MKESTNTILIIEDDAGLNDLISEKTESYGYQTACVQSAKDALDWLEVNTPYLMILDYSLPDMNGKEFITELKTKRRTLPPFIVCTGRGDEHIAVEMMKLGASDYVIKDIQLLNIIPIIIQRVGKEIENDNKLILIEQALAESNQFNKQVIRSAKEGIIVYGLDLKYQLWNPFMEDLTGIPAFEVLGKHPSDIFPFLKKYGVINSIEKAMHGDLVLEIDFPFNIPVSGKSGWVSHTAAPLFKTTGEILGVITTIRDITERKRAEETLKVSEKKYRTMVNASPDGILITDLKGIITEASEICVELFGFDHRNNLTEKHFSNLVPVKERNVIQKLFEKTKQDGLVTNVELKIRKKNQTVFLSEISITLIKSIDKKPYAFLIIIRDISNRKKFETMQIHADRMASLGEMATGMAHEINQPLNNISLVMDNILAFKDGNIEKDYLSVKMDKIFGNITRIRNIIDHVRAFSRRNDECIKTAFDVNESINNAISMMFEQSKNLSISIIPHLDGYLPSIIGDTYKFEQVIINLLSNAKDALLEKKAKQSSNIDMVIAIKSFRENHRIIVELKDNGMGISKENIDRVMLPFYTTKHDGKGTGLGLSISYQIIKEMNGTMEITSKRSIGTTVKIILEIQNIAEHGKSKQN